MTQVKHSLQAHILTTRSWPTYFRDYFLRPIQGIPVDLVHQGTSITCCLTEKIVVEPESYKNISLESPLPDNIRDEEPAIILQNCDKGLLNINLLFYYADYYLCITPFFSRGGVQ